MIHTSFHRDEYWRAGLRDDGARCRCLWAKVVLNAVIDASNELAKARRKRDVELERTIIARFRSWGFSNDGREVMRNAGIVWTPRVVDALTAQVATGCFAATIDGRKRNAA